jgi:hypothetical protein
MRPDRAIKVRLPLQTLPRFRASEIRPQTCTGFRLPAFARALPPASTCTRILGGCASYAREWYAQRFPGTIVNKEQQSRIRSPRLINLVINWSTIYPTLLCARYVKF